MTNPSEQRHPVRKDFDDFLTGVSDERLKAEDTREITEQMPDLMGDWAQMEALMNAPKPAPSGE